MMSRRCSKTTLRWSFMTLSYLRMFLAHVEVATFDLLLCLLERLVDPGMDDSLVLLEAKPHQHRIHSIRTEDAHEIIGQRQEEFRAAWVTLTAGAAAQLIVDAAALVALGADDVETAGFERLFLETRDFGTNLRFLRVAFRAFRQTGAFLRNAHFDVATELNVGATARILVATVTAPGTPASATI